jgi:hypothetical protein
MENVMVDLETLGRGPGCVVLSIGAVTFDENGLGEEFYMVVNQESCEEHGLLTDPETLAWWEKQNPEARKVLDEAKTGGVPLPMALAAFSEYVREYGPGKVKVWGNGASFDNAIIAACYGAIGEKLPWQFWNDRCYRTFKAMFPTVKLERQGTYHNALDDAKTQAEHAVMLLGALNGRG